MTKMQGDQAETQEQIVKAAIRHFAEYGYKGASISKIAEEAGVSKSLIFWYFESKNRLFQFLIDYFIKSCKENLKNAGPGGNARDKIEGLIDTYWEYICQNLWFVRIFINWFMQLEPRKKDKSSVVREIHSEFRQMFSDYLEEGKQEGLFRQDLDVFHTSLFLVSTLEGILLQMIVEEVEMKKLGTEFFTTLKNNLMQGLLQTPHSK